MVTAQIASPKTAGEGANRKERKGHGTINPIAEETEAEAGDQPARKGAAAAKADDPVRPSALPRLCMRPAPAGRRR